jgi:phosphoglycolate phosphatase
MVKRAMEEFGVAPDRTVLIGDTAADVEAGKAAGCRAIRVGEGGVAFGEAVRRVIASL